MANELKAYTDLIASLSAEQLEQPVTLGQLVEVLKVVMETSQVLVDRIKALEGKSNG